MSDDETVVVNEPRWPMNVSGGTPVAKVIGPPKPMPRPKAAQSAATTKRTRVRSRKL